MSNVLYYLIPILFFVSTVTLMTGYFLGLGNFFIVLLIGFVAVVVALIVIFILKMMKEV